MEKVIINKNRVTIKLNKKITNLSTLDITEIYSLVKLFRSHNHFKNNNVKSCLIWIKVFSQFEIDEWINILNLFNKGNLINWVEYFENFEENFTNQTSESDIVLDDYVNNEYESKEYLIIVYSFIIEDINMDELMKEYEVLKDDILRKIKL